MIKSKPKSETARSCTNTLALSAIALAMIASMYLIFIAVPPERVMGAVQRIFYSHLGAAIACYIAFGIVFFASIFYIATRDDRADRLSEASGEVGFVFCTIVLVTGMIWGQSAWNTFFRWEPRLVSFLMLWLIFLAFVLLRAFGDPEKIKIASAVLGIIGTLTVPIVIFSVKFLAESEQLHPQVVAKRGLKAPMYWYTLFGTMATFIAFELYLICLRYRIGSLGAKLRQRRLYGKS